MVSATILLSSATSLECASWVYAHDEKQAAIAREKASDRTQHLERPATDAKASDQKFALRNTPLRFLPLTPMQATKVNAAIRLRQDVGRWLSPRQKLLLGMIELQLASNPQVLIDLTQPKSIDQLDEYVAQLRAALNEPAVIQSP